MHIKPFQALYPKLEYITSTDSFFDSAKEEYSEYVETGFYNKFSRKAFFVHQIRSPRRKYTGIVACSDIEDYLRGKIKKHEHTLPSKEQKQLQLLLKRRAAVKPVLLTYPEVPAISEWTLRLIEDRPPFLEVHFDAERQSQLLWEVCDDRHIREIQQLFAEKVPTAYIADGHHRTTSVALLFQRTRKPALKERYRNLFCAFFPSSDLDIQDFNRVVEGLNQLSLTRFMAKIAQLFEIKILEKPIRPRRKHEILLFLNREWYLLRWKPQILETCREDAVVLDSHLLNELVLKDILGIDDVRTDQRVDYVAGPEGLEGLWKRATSKESCIGFCLYPVQLEEMITLADQGKALPPKSTWFEPRIKNGLIIYEI
jgi:uncharacterized protein (DUF1015 family)